MYVKQGAQCSIYCTRDIVYMIIMYKVYNIKSTGHPGEKRYMTLIDRAGCINEIWVLLTKVEL